MGRLDACGGDHLVFFAPQTRGIPISLDEKAANTLEEDISLVWYGVGNVIVPLAAIVGLTIVGASAAAGFW
jgi:hypothetical protein